MKKGKSRTSYLVFAGTNVHFFVWSPKTGADSVGGTLRWRVNQRDWQHFRLIFLQRNTKGAPGQHGRELKRRLGQRVITRKTLTLAEISSWKTQKGTQDRIGTKGYIRLKAAWPGKIKDGT